MKKLIGIFLLILVSAGFLSADSLQPIPFPFIGKWNPSESPELLDDFGLQDVQNVRKVGKRFKGIGGHTIINSTSIATYTYLLNGFHFYKDQPQESHVIVLATSTTTSPGASYLYQNTTAIPGTGNFSATTLHTDATAGIGRGRFSMAPAGNMVYANGAETLIWGGSEIEPTSFISHSTALATTNTLLTNSKDYSEAVINTLTTPGNYAAIDAPTFPVWFIGTTRPIQAAKFYVLTSNTSASTITVNEWAGNQWNSRAVTDNTKIATVSLATTGTVTWTSSADRPKYLGGLSLYWYQFALSAGNANIYYVTVDAPLQSIKNIWDGEEVSPAKVLKYIGSTTHVDYTDDAIDELTSTYVDASSLTSSRHILVGFTQRMQGLNFTMKADSENSASATAVQVNFWNGSSFTATYAQNDGTANGTVSFSKSGVISWSSPAYGYEFKKAIADELPLYYYQIVPGSTLDDDCKISEIRGIPFPNDLKTYAFSETFQNRLFLFNEYAGDKNKAIYSGANTPDIFNGQDSSYLYFGDKTELIAAKPLYNVFRTFAAEQLIVTKKNETWRVSGDGPENWVVNRMSGNVGCVAPLSMVNCEVSDSAEQGTKRQVAIWQSDKGFVMTDGAAVIPISDEIRCYFDPNDSRYIPTTRQSKTVAWFDPFTRSYKALISSGSTATYHNIELEYSLDYKEWTKIYRVDASGADPLQSGFQVFDTNGVGYTYGGNTKGFVYRLENGGTFAGTNITNKIQTKDLILDAQLPMFRKSTVKFFRTAHKKKTGSVTVAHYGDQVLTVSGSTNQQVPSAFSTASTPYNTQACNLGPFLFHSFLFTSVTSTLDGMELNGLAIYAEPQTALR
jgi:hypothetical protein